MFFDQRSRNMDSKLLFGRFFKSTKSSKSLGLGLPIVKKITELFKIDITYTYSENMHTVKLIFPQKEEKLKNSN